ncbi:MAG: hypothetical protein PVJ36_06450 [Nitrospirota bacterium]
MENDETCPVCKKPKDQCVCCPECGHVCPLELGEPYCPVCKPKPKGAG